MPFSPADLVEVFDQGHAVHLLAVDSGGDALLKVDGHIGRGIGGLFGADAELEEASLL